MAILYRHIRLDKNEPFYIGIGKSIERAYTKRNRNKIWNQIVNKTDYEVEILFDNISWEDACKKEYEFINLYGRIDINTGSLCNLTNGGEGTIGYVFSENHKKLISESNSKRVISIETRIKISKSKIGKKLTKEQIEKRKELLKDYNYKKGKDHHNYNKKLTEEHKQKLRVKRNKPAWNSGIKRTDIIGGKHGRAKIVLNTENGIFYDCAKDAAKYENINYNVLNRHLNNTNTKYKKLIYA